MPGAVLEDSAEPADGLEGPEAKPEGQDHHHHPKLHLKTHHHRHLHRKDPSAPDLTKLNDSSPKPVERSAISFVDVPQGRGSPRKASPGRVRRYIHQMQKSRKKLPSEPSYIPSKGVNLRDVGAVTRGPMRECAVFRSSELLSKDEMQANQIKTILDLRRMDRPCKAKGIGASESTKTIIKYLLLGPTKIIPEKRLIPAHRAHPRPCELCHAKAKRRYESDINVIHADLIPSTVGLRIFQSMPWRVQVKTILSALTGKGAGSVMAPAVANNNLLGYKALYHTLLEDSKRGMAMAIRPFVEADNYPILVHCIHGKDRTGLIIMLLLMLCNVPTEAIVDDYVMSESVLKESRMHKELHLDVYLTTDEVIAATKETMEDTITYVNEKYGGAAEYFKECGLEKEEIEAISKNLMREEDLAKADISFKPRFSILDSISSLNPFRGRISTSGGPDGKTGKSRPSTDGLSRVSEGGSGLHQKSSSLQNHPSDSLRSMLPPEKGEHIRRASIATTTASEIRARLNKMRSEHPELGPLTEDDPIDFLRASDRSVRNGKLHSMDVNMNSGLASQKPRNLFGRKLEKTESCPVTPTVVRNLDSLGKLPSEPAKVDLDTVISQEVLEASSGVSGLRIRQAPSSPFDSEKRLSPGEPTVQRRSREGSDHKEF